MTQWLLAAFVYLCGGAAVVIVMATPGALVSRDGGPAPRISPAAWALAALLWPVVVAIVLYNGRRR